MLKTKKRLWLRRLALTVCLIALGWLILTLWVERIGVARTWHKPVANASRKVIVIFDPDPIYNLDEKVCRAFANGLAQRNTDVVVATVSAVDETTLADFDAYVLCANTYNWAPDWAVTDFIKKHDALIDKPIVAITVGSGSTRRAQQLLENSITGRGGRLVASNTYWLMRPNDEQQLDKSNVDVAVSLAFGAGVQIADSIFVE
ncbi:hypothetical protein [Chryseolinea lacunae]|uniref:Uncharacterized protein n=1 Tax=Chryseolinea lacunae TaxID=2801331 RepID=A0ABS1KUI0_9BACT|nr:hypothetical protein [Chryseolinea lacunae]MBL0743029.1 hypothetical protein [Chryseolinea lacunae]